MGLTRIGLAVLVMLMASLASSAQNIGINEDGSTPNGSAILDIKSSNKGLLIPRLTSFQRTNISAPAQGLMVYDTSTNSFWYYNASAWVEGSKNGSQLWETTGGNIYRASGNVGIGTSTPSSTLHLKASSTNQLAMRFDGLENVIGSGSRASWNNTGLSLNATSAQSWSGSSNSAASTGGTEWTGGLVGDNEQSDYLRITFTAFSASIPSDATVTGLNLILRKRASASSDIYDNTIRLVKNGSMVGDNKSEGQAWSTSLQNRQYGSSTDLWSTSITPAELNNGQIGCMIQYDGDMGTLSPDARGYIDFAQLRVYYTTPATDVTRTWSIGTNEGEFRIASSSSISGFSQLIIDDSGVTELDGLRLPSGASLDRVLASDANGNASWTDIDNLTTAWTTSGVDIINPNTGKVFIGNWTGPALGTYDKLAVEGNIYSTGQNPHSLIHSYAIPTAYNASPRVILRRSIGSASAEVPLTDGTLVGSVDFSGRNSFNYSIGAQILSRAQGDWSTSAYGGDLRFHTKAYSDVTAMERMIISEDGNVGIGESNPTFAFHMPNDATAGLARAHTWSTYSDRRIKSSIEPLEGSLNTVMALNPVSYIQHKAAFDGDSLTIDVNSGTEKMGFIAQELYEVAPKSVAKPNNENEQLWGVDYSSLIPLLTKAIQEQQAEIELLKSQIRQLSGSASLAE